MDKNNTKQNFSKAIYFMKKMFWKKQLYQL